jgi:ParB-like chromosome segregation protein Spo0J
VRLPVSDVRVDPHIQLRSGPLDMERVEDMAVFVQQGGTLPPITVVGEDNLLADGHHRLYMHKRAGIEEIEANRKPGGKAEAVAYAIAGNSEKTHLPLTRAERNKGVRWLLEAGWTQRQVGEATGIHQTTVMNIHQAMVMRGQVAKPAEARVEVAVLPPEVHEKLNDTTLVRIADLPYEQQAEMAEAVAAQGVTEHHGRQRMPEPRVREAIKDVKAGYSVAEAVQRRALPEHDRGPVSPPHLAARIERILDAFTNDKTVQVDGVAYNIWDVIEVFARAETVTGNERRHIADELRALAVKAEHYATMLTSTPALKAVRS